MMRVCFTVQIDFRGMASVASCVAFFGFMASGLASAGVRLASGLASGRNGDPRWGLPKAARLERHALGSDWVDKTVRTSRDSLVRPCRRARKHRRRAAPETRS